MVHKRTQAIPTKKIITNACFKSECNAKMKLDETYARQDKAS